MSPVRLSTGRRVSPLRRPGIAGVKDLELDRTPHRPFPTPAELKLIPEDALQSFQVHLEVPIVLEMPLGTLDRKEISSFPVEPAMLEEADSPFNSLSTGHVEGKVYLHSEIDDTSTPLPRAYSYEYQGGVPTSVQTLEALEDFFPILSPPVLEEDEPFGLVPLIREYQKDAVHALMAEEGLLLADDLGTGKTIAVTIALFELFHEARISHAILLCPETDIRHWVQHLHRWAPSIAVTVIRGDQIQRNLDWENRAHLHLCGYNGFIQDKEEGISGLPTLTDLIIVDAIHAAQRVNPEIWDGLQDISAPRRWAMAGGLPKDMDEWKRTFQFIAPDISPLDPTATTKNLKRHYATKILRRTREEILQDIPRLSRQEIWLDLDSEHWKSYEDVLERERQRLAQLGSAVSRTHIDASVRRLKRTSNFIPGSFDGIKMRALLELAEQVLAADLKMVVITHDVESNMEPLEAALVPYGLVMLEDEAQEGNRLQALSVFRNDPDKHILLTDAGIRIDGESLIEAPYVLHFDHNWNPAVRLGVEQRLHPHIGPGAPVHVYEFWVAGTIDQKLHNSLKSRRLLPADLTRDTRPAQLEESLTPDEWLKEIIQVEKAEIPQRRAVRPRPGTGLLPATSELRFNLTLLTPDEYISGVIEFMGALGFAEAEPVSDVGDKGGKLLAWRIEGEDRVERVLVHAVRGEKNVGVGVARKLLKEMEKRKDCLGAYLIVTSDFTASCKKLAEETGSQLALVSGGELIRHLHILGWNFPD